MERNSQKINKQENNKYRQKWWASSFRVIDIPEWDKKNKRTKVTSKETCIKI